MSLHPILQPECVSCDQPEVETIIEGRARDLDGLKLRRILPSVARRMVGPFIFFDHMGPDTLPPGRGIEVRPHPHINLATVTYLFEGAIVHKDSLGFDQIIEPGAINWMTAGRGIVHSERSREADRVRGQRLHGIQLWLALPREHEECEPAFHHHPAATLPEVEAGNVRLRVLAGTAFGVTAPVQILSPLFYAEAQMQEGSRLELAADYAERAFYVASGVVRCASERAEPGRMFVVKQGTTPVLAAEADARVLLLGGAPLPEKRHMFWNFVSSRPERIEQAKRDWKERRFPTVPGDDQEFIPLPE